MKGVQEHQSAFIVEAPKPSAPAVFEQPSCPPIVEGPDHQETMGRSAWCVDGNAPNRAVRAGDTVERRIGGLSALRCKSIMGFDILATAAPLRGRDAEVVY